MNPGNPDPDSNENDAAAGDAEDRELREVSPEILVIFVAMVRFAGEVTGRLHRSRFIPKRSR